MDAWKDFIEKTDSTSLGAAVVNATVDFFVKSLGIESPVLADGYTEDMLSAHLPKERSGGLHSLGAENKLLKPSRVQTKSAFAAQKRTLHLQQLLLLVS